MAELWDIYGPEIEITLRWRQIIIGVCGGALIALAPLGAVGALFSPLIFDNPGNRFNPFAWLAFILTVGFWVICIVAPLGAWWLFRNGREPLAWGAVAAPVAWIVLLLAIIQFLPG